MKKTTYIFDVDGTLIDPKRYIVPTSAIKALKHLHNEGISCCIATGRSYESLMDTMIKNIIPWSGFICSNGQHVLNHEGETIFKYVMSPLNIQRAIALAKQHNINVQFQGNPSFMLREPDEVVILAHQFFHEPIPEIVKEYENEDIDMLMIYHQDVEKLKLFNSIPGINVYLGQSTYADVVDFGQSKYTGIKHYFNYINQEIDYVAFGDSDNDIEMSEEASLSIALGNASHNLKKVAHIIAPNVDNDGLAWAIEYALKKNNR